MRLKILFIVTITALFLGLEAHLLRAEDEASAPATPVYASSPVHQAEKPQVSAENASPEGGVRVVLITVDGFRTDLVREMPGFRKMLKHGAWTLHARSTVPSITTTGHASIYTGQPPEVHSVLTAAPRGEALKTWAPLKTRTIFEDLDPVRYKPAAFIQKEKLLRLLPDKAFVRKVLDRATRESRLVKAVCEEVAKSDGSRMLVVHFKRFDTIGHEDGWMSAEQLAATKPMDDALLAVSGCIAKAQRGGAGTFALIVTADHGGTGRDHDTRRDTDMHVPWLVIGPGVKVGYEIRREMHLMDTAAVMRYFLGYGASVHDGIRGRFPREILAQ